MKIKRFILILTCLLMGSAAFAQNIRVTGQVKDAQSGEPVSFVTVIQQGTGNAVSADADGRYAINVPANATLRFSSVGYDEVLIEVAGRNVVDVAMNSDNVLEEAVVSALGITRAAKSLTYAEQVVSSDEIAGNRAANMITSLAGKASGVTVTQSAAGMGGSAKISIRGFRSVNSGNEPLYIINGVPMSSGADVSGDTYGSGGMASVDNGDGIGNINPDDIESITILKGASASALYGTQAANGVILITTKKGVAGQTHVTFNSTTNFENAVYRHELQNAYGHDDSWKSWGAKISNGVVAADNYFETAHTLNNTLSVQSGNDRNQTYLSYGNTTANSILGNNSKLSRHNITFRNTTKFADNVTLDASVQFIRQYTKNRPTTGGLYHNPVMSVYHFPADLNLAEYKEKFEVYDMDRNLMVQNWYKPLTANDDENPYWITNRIINEQWRDRAMGSLTLRWDITPKIYVQGRGSVDYSARRQSYKAYATTTPSVVLSENGQYITGKRTSMTAYADFLAGYKDNWGDFGFNATVGTSINYDESTNTTISSRYGGGELKLANIFTINNMTVRAADESWYRGELIGVFATATLSYKDWLFLDVTGRNDWSSTLAFSQSFKTGFFYPSVGLSAILNEALNMPSWIDLFKVRASYAVVGNDLPSRITNPLGSVAYSGSVSSNTTAPFGELKPELSASFETGFDLRMFNNRLSLDFEYYKTNTRNQLFSLDAPAGSGYSTYYVNSGNIQNQGIEATLGFIPVETRNFTWKSSVNLGLNRNKVIALNDEIQTFVVNEATNHGYAVKLTEGGSFGDLFVRRFARDASGNLLLDDKGLPYKESGEFTYIGNTEAKMTAGWNNNFQIGNFNVNFLIDARFGGVALDATQADLDGWGASAYSAKCREQGYVEYEGHKFNDVEAFFKRVGGFEGINEFYVYDATNVRLREASIGYSLPKKLLGNVCQDVSLSLVGRNLLFFYKNIPYDPDTLLDTDGSFQGFSFFGMPTPRSLGFNIKVTF